MSTRSICVVVRAGGPDRVAEALRAAIGLGLRGDRVTTVITGAAAAACAAGDPRITRALATLETLGHAVVRGEPALGAALEHAAAVEVWT